MDSSSSADVVKERKELLNVQLISNEIKQPHFWNFFDIIYKGDMSGALSMIPPQVLMIQDIRCCYTCKVKSIGDMEIRELYGKLCENGVLKEYKVVKRKVLTRALDFPNIFKIEWIKIVLSRIHDNYVWLEDGPIKITKRIIHRLTRYPTLDKPKTMRSEQKRKLRIIQGHYGTREG